MKKKRILMVSEASYTLSGFGTYTKEVLSRLYKTGKYELAEFASYAHVNDPRDVMPWRIYPNHPTPGVNDPRNEQFNDPNKPVNIFGAWRFERVLLDYRPDIVFDIRDPWMFLFQNQSPLRRFFHWAIMPTVDSAPQQEEWICNFADADAIFTYSDWGLETLRKEGGSILKLQKSAPPGVNLNEFVPIPNSVEHRKKYGLSPEMNIIGTVMRNQRRKLFPDLMLAFKEYLKICEQNNNKALAKNSYLYFHTSYPDIAGCWNLPRLIRENGLGSKILFTYICKNCKQVSVRTFQDVRAVCHNCNSLAAILPSVGNGLTTQQLNEVYNLFDVYIQYANCEGFGMPQVEAASSGLPIMATDYSAMSDVVRKLKGYPVKVARMFRSPEEDAYRALPDNKDCAEQLYKFFQQPISVRKKKGFEARECVKKHYTWDKTAKIWEDYFDSATLTGLQGKWDSAPDFIPDIQIPQQEITDEQFLDALYMSVRHEQNMHRVLRLDIAKALSNEIAIGHGQNPIAYNRQMALDKFASMANNYNQCEQLRCGMQQMMPEDYIEYAHRRPV